MNQRQPTCVAMQLQSVLQQKQRPQDDERDASFKSTTKSSSEMHFRRTERPTWTLNLDTVGDLPRKARLHVAFVDTVLLVHALCGVTVLFETIAFWKEQPDDVTRLCWALGLAVWDILIGLAFAATLCLRKNHYSRYMVRLWLVMISWFLHLAGHIALMAVRVNAVGWDQIISEIFDSQMKADIAWTTIVVLSLAVALLNSLAIISHSCQRETLDLLRPWSPRRYAASFGVPGAATGAYAPPLDYIFASPYSCAHRRHNAQASIKRIVSPESPYANSTIEDLKMVSLKNNGDYKPGSTRRGGPVTPMHSAVINELKTSLPAWSAGKSRPYGETIEVFHLP